MHIIRAATSLSVALVCLAIASCTPGDVTIRSEPPGAEIVTSDGRVLGTTPVTRFAYDTLPSHWPYDGRPTRGTITARMAGCTEQSRSVGEFDVPDEILFRLDCVVTSTIEPGAGATGPSQIAVAPTFTGTERRLALVIGNGEYQRTARLRNPVTDAADIAATLQSLNFRVKLVRNAKQRDMEDVIRGFGRDLRPGDVGLFYFAGHGIQLEGENYLLPVDASLDSAADVRHKTVPMNWVLDTLRETENGFNVIIFDACRNNPFPRGYRAAVRGLAAAPKVRGALIAYSTSPGDVAEDGQGRNSPYARALLQHIRAPGVAIEQMFKQVRIAVEQDTGGKQTPWELSSLTGDFYFARQ